ncbi:MAG: hypothetical protein E6224_11580, partial [Haemophilus parainfluenzae]|nr:hypothetical protein [Haemophilus parainfluenzae]
LRDEAIKIITRIKPTDVVARDEEEHETELTRLAENSVEKGVNDIQSGEKNRDDEFGSVKKKSESAERSKKNKARKAKKAQRQNKKKGRK